MRGPTAFVISGATLLACAATIGVIGQGGFTPAQYRSGELPQISIRALGGGEVLLELTVTGNGLVSSIATLRATPPYTEALGAVANRWQFNPAVEELEATAGQPPDPKPRQPVESKVLVAGIFRPPTINTPTLGEPPTETGIASEDIPFPVTIFTPPYPPLARDTGVVLVEVRVDTAGRVTDARTIRSSPPFDEPALDAARRWTFRPARRRGIPVAAAAYVVFGFRQPVTIKSK
jgi:TonB family protein